ncbi:Ulp1 family isopeptidase [Bradyrhizobium sp. UFLA05-112]
MECASTNPVRQQLSSAAPQENSPAPSADATAFEQQLSETSNSGGRVLMQPSRRPGASASEAQPVLQRTGAEDSGAPNSGGGGSAPTKSTGVLVGHSNRPVYSQDALIISRLGSALVKGGAAKCTAENNVSNLLTLDRWLFENGKKTIAARLNDESLAADVEEFIKKGGTKKVRKALDHLRTSESAGGVVPITGIVKLSPYPQDAALIRQYKNETRTATGRNNATALTRFSDYLREKSKRTIAGRLSDKSLENDVDEYKTSVGYDPKIVSALGRLRKSQAGAQAIEVERLIAPASGSEDEVLTEPTCIGDASTQQSLSEVAISWPEVLPAEGHDQDVSLEMMNETAPSSPFQSSTPVDPSLGGTSLIMQQSVQNHSPAPYGEDGGAMLCHSLLPSTQPVAAYVDGSQLPLYSDDASLIFGLEEAVAGSDGEHLLNLSRWLFASDKPGIAARLHDDSLSQDVEEFERSWGSSSLLTTLARLKAPRSADVAPPLVKRAVLKPYPKDAALINEYKKAPAGGITQDTAKTYATLLADFSSYLRKKSKPGIAAQISARSLHELDKDVEGYKDSGGKRKIRTALAHFLKSRGGVRAIEPERWSPAGPDPVVVLTEPRHVGEDAAHHSASLGGVSLAEVRRAEEDDQSLAWEMMDEARPSSALELTAQVAASLTDTASGREYIQESQEGGATLPGASASQPGQSPWAFVGPIGDPLYSQDASLINRLRPALIKRGFKPRTIRDNVNALLRLGRWLLKSKKPEMAARLNHESLDEDTKVFDKTPNGSILTALRHLRASQSQSGGTPIASRAELNPYDNDAALIKEYKATTTKNFKTTSTYATALGRFSEYLRGSNKPGFAARLSSKSLDEDVSAYRKEPDSNRKIGAALAHLRESPTGTRAIELEEPSCEEVLNDERVPQDTTELALVERTPAFDDSQALPADRRLCWSDNLGDREPQAFTDDLETVWQEAQPTMYAGGYGCTTSLHTLGESAEFSINAKADSGRRFRVDRGPSTRPIYPEDASFISGLKEAMISAGYQERTAVATAQALRRLSQWLLVNEKPAINAQLESKLLDLDAKKCGGYFAGLSLAHLRAFKSAGGIAPIKRRGEVAETAEQHGASQRPFNWPVELAPGEDDQRVSEQTLSWLGIPGEDNAQMTLEPAASGYPAQNPGEAFQSSVSHRLDIINLSPSEEVMINCAHGTADFAPAKRRRIFSPQSLATTTQSASQVAMTAAAVHESPYPDDADLIKKYKLQAVTEGTASTAKGYASLLTDFSRYLRQNKKHSIAAQLNDRAVDKLETDANLYREAGGYRAVTAALAHLRAGASKRIPAPLYSADASLIADLEPALIGAGYEAITAKTLYVRPLRRFSQWLFANDRSGIADRLEDESLDNDAAAFEKDRKNRVSTALDRLRDSRSEGGIAPIIVRQGNVERVALKHNWPEELPPEGDDQDLLWAIEEDGPPNGLTSHEQTQEVEQAPRQEPAGSTSTWSLQIPSDFDWSLWPAWEAAPSLPVAAQPPLTPYELRDDADYAFPRTPPDALVGTWDPAASIHGPSGRILDDLEWLGDEHIAADYALLSRDLQSDNPDLAARTRFVEPATAHMLRRTLNEDVILENLHGIVNDKDGNDTARFLFLPVNDDEDDGGRHWSLLLLDRAAREGPVAYHYDSAEGRNHTSAAKLAEALHARLERRPMAQQQNSYDCGVYVVDGTRELVGQLAQGQRPELLNLDHLVANRGALQNRLRQ